MGAKIRDTYKKNIIFDIDRNAFQLVDTNSYSGDDPQIYYSLLHTWDYP